MSDLETELKKLNPEQLKAVEAIEGPVLVVAGPGSGKTRVISYRIANILDKTDSQASNILCLTFTESGVKAMRDKLKDVIGKDSYYISIHTFHSFCNEVIQTFPEKFAFRSELKNLDDISRAKLIKDVLDDMPVNEKYLLRPLYDPYANKKVIIDAIQNLKREGITDIEFSKTSLEEFNEVKNNPEINTRTNKPTVNYIENLNKVTKNYELSICYTLYQNKLKELGFYDYEDMILFVIEKLTNDDEVLAYYQEKYLHILVDEFQDSNGSQVKLLNVLGSYDKSPNIFAVGDDDQAIYRFQGANVSNMLDFVTSFENVKVLPLNKNYRSSQTILDGAQSLIKKNKLRLTNEIPNLDKDLKAESNINNHKIEVYPFKSNNFENKFIVDKIKELKDSGEDLNDIAVFYRNHNDSIDLIELLLKQNIPFKLASGSNLLEERLVKQIINLLKVIDYTDENRDLILFKVLFYDYLDFNKLDIFKVTTYGRRVNASLFDILSDKDKLTECGVSDIEKLNNFANNIVEWNKISANTNIYDLLEDLLNNIKFFDYLINIDKNIENMNSISSFLKFVKNSYLEDKEITLNKFLEDINLAIDSNISLSKNELDINQNGVNLMTAHRSKGLEFKHVFILKATSESWEAKRSRNFFKLNINALLSDSVIKEEEERRLFFVALTRAKEYLYISYSEKYLKKDGETVATKSKFIDDIDSKYLDILNTKDFEIEDTNYFSNILLNSKHINNSIDESEYLKYLINSFKLSASALNAYIKCPLGFKYDYLIKAPRVVNQSSARGTAIHYALEVLNTRFLKNPDYQVSINEILDIYTTKLRKTLPDIIGSNRSSFDSINTEDRDILSKFVLNNLNRFSNVAEVEYKFNSRDIIFEIDNEDPIELTGKIDKLEWIDKNTNRARIVDYKFKTPLSLNQIKGETKVSDKSIYNQLVFYSILSSCDKFFKPKFSPVKYNVLDYEVVFVKPNNRDIYKSEVLTFTNEEVNDFKLMVVDIVKRIRNLEFYGSNEYPLCKDCTYCKEIIQQ